jgi:hypothetical protein
MGASSRERKGSEAQRLPHDPLVGFQVMGLFPRAAWLELIAAAGFEPLAVPFEHSSSAETEREILLGLRPIGGEEK